MSNSELIVPAGAMARKDNREILRAWRVGEGFHCSLAACAWDEPSVWGLVLADTAQHIARALQQTTGASPDDTLDSIRNMFNSELLNHTDTQTGGRCETMLVCTSALANIASHGSRQHTVVPTAGPNRLQRMALRAATETGR